jgi:TolA-binding protein
MKMTKKILRIAVAATLMAAFAVPASASAANGPSSAGTSIQTSRPGTITASRGEAAEMLRTRIENGLRLRDRVFNNSAERLQERIRSMEQLCDRIEEAGGNTERVRSQLEIASGPLEDAGALEYTARNQFRNVPDAENPRGMFGSAKALGGEAVGELKRTRTQLRTALQELKDVVTELKEG